MNKGDIRSVILRPKIFPQNIWHHRIQILLSLTVFFWVTILGANCISEISERKSVYNYLKTEIIEMEKCLTLKSGKCDYQKINIEDKALLFKQLSRDIINLSDTGAISEKMTLNSIKRRMRDLPVNGTNYIKDSVFRPLTFFFMPKVIDVSASARMTAFLIIFASVLGSIVQIHQNQFREPLRRLVLGVGAGIFAYLSYLAFTYRSIDYLGLNGPPSNLYVPILFGFLTGIFSKKVYDFMERRLEIMMENST